jgi:cytochrome c-type biogenesis protein CcmH
MLATLAPLAPLAPLALLVFGSPGLCAEAAAAQAVAMPQGVEAPQAVAAPQAAAPPAVPTEDLDANGQMRNSVLQARFERIAKDLRCLVCQNESIADSNVELAGDLRRQVREMLVAGKSDDAIFDFMTDRYGDFVRFNPPVERKTALIWGAPFIVLLVGVIIVVQIVRRRSRMPLDDEPSPGSL